MKIVLKIGALGCLMAGLLYGSAMAQSAGEAQEADRMLAEFEEENGNGILDEDIEALSRQEMQERGEAKLGAMRVTLESTTELLEQARQDDRDILKINCINENLASIKGFVNVGEQSYESLVESSDGNDVEAARHHYTLISIAGQRVTGLGEQARVCAGEELRYAEDAVLEVRVDPEMGTPDHEFMGRIPERARDRMPEHVLDRLPRLTPFQ